MRLIRRLLRQARADEHGAPAPRRGARSMTGGAPTGPAPDEAAPRTPRIIIARSLLRAGLSATLLLVLYYVAPMDSSLADTHTVLLLVLCLAAFVGVATW